MTFDRKANSKKYYEDNKEAMQANNKRWRAANPDQDASSRAKRYAAKPWCYMLDGSRARSKKNGIPFNLTNDYLASIWTDECPVLGVTFESRTQSGASLDRHVPDLGYVEGNVTFVSR